MGILKKNKEGAMIKKIIINFFRSIVDLFLSDDGLIRRKIGSHIMYLDPKDSGISSELKRMINGEVEREPAFMKILRNEVQPGMVVMDLGANLGYVSLIMAEIVGSSGKVYAIEPNPHNYKILNKNISTNQYADIIFPFQMGISNKDGMMDFYISDKTNLGGMMSSKHTKGSIQVKIKTLDTFLKDKEIPNFIKMDIEGHEVEVLDGMYNVAKKTVNSMKILMEIHTELYSINHNLEKQLRNYIDIGFNVKYVISAGVAIPDLFKHYGYFPKETFKTGKWVRAIYDNISNEHAIIAACRKHKQYLDPIKGYTEKIIRAIMIEKK